MKLLFTIAGIVILVMMGIVGIGFGILAYEGSLLDTSSKAYVETNLPEIVATWTPDELNKRECSDFRDATSDADLATLFNKFKKLGAYQSMGESKGESSVHGSPNGLQITATYIVPVKFANGDAMITISLVQISGDWQILGFRVNSAIFAS